MNFKNAFLIVITTLLIAIPVIEIQKRLLPGEKYFPYKYWISTVLISIASCYLLETISGDTCGNSGNTG